MKQISNCPYCSGSFEIKKMKCLKCETEINGSFHMNRFHMLNSNELYFVEVFLKNEGSIKMVERDLGISYPTVKSKLSKICEILGYKGNDFADKSKSSSLNKEVLTQLEKGEINVNEVIKKLKGQSK